MDFFSRFAPLRAYRDLRQFLAGRERHEFVFLLLAMLITTFFVYAFAKDSHVQPAYKPNIIYVEQWSASRTDDEIRAQQKIDAVAKAKRVAERKAFEDKKRAEFKKVDDALSKWGI
jgi:hypothetical protein